jgi:hypothetical protein
MPPAAAQDQTKAEPFSPNLSEPYQQAQHPFAQFQIKATEVMAYSEPLEYTGENLASNIPEMPPTYGGYQPLSDAYSAYQPQPHPAYHVKDCGCGGGMAAGGSYAEPWNTYPQQPPMEMPYSPYQMQPVPGMFPYSTMPVPYYPMTGGEFHPGFNYGAGHPDMGYANPASPGPSQLAPQAHIHQWPENQTQEEQPNREASTEKTISKSSGKSAGASKKTNSRKQQQREDKVEQKTNLPWINV